MSQKPLSEYDTVTLEEMLEGISSNMKQAAHTNMNIHIPDMRNRMAEINAELNNRRTGGTL